MKRVFIILLASTCSSLWGADAVVSRTNFTATVIAQRENEGYFFARQDDSALTWRVSMDGRPYRRFRPGDRVCVSGELEPHRHHTTRLFSCDVEKFGYDIARVPPPRKTSLSELEASFNNRSSIPNPDWYGDLVEVVAKVGDIVRNERSVSMMVMDSGSHCWFNIVHPMPEPLPEKLEIGSEIRIVAPAVYSVGWNEDQFRGINSYSFIPDSIEAITVVKTGPFWDEKRLWRLSATLVVFLVVVIGWFWIVWRDGRRERRIAEAVHRERLRLSYDLHDDLQQLLASCVFQLAALRNRCEQGAEKVVLAKGFAALAQALDRTQAGLRSILWSINEEAEGPSQLSELLTYAASRLAHWGERVRFVFEGTEPNVSRRLAGEILMSLQETVGNAIRHGEAQLVEVKVSFSEKEMVVRVSDNGCGFDVKKMDMRKGTHIGLAGVRHRIEMQGGEMSVESAPDKGTVVTMRVPL